MKNLHFDICNLQFAFKLLIELVPTLLRGNAISDAPRPIEKYEKPFLYLPKYLIIILFIIFSLIFSVSSLQAQYATSKPSRIKWYELDSEHFKVLYPANYDTLAYYTLIRAERAYNLLTPFLQNELSSRFTLIINNGRKPLFSIGLFILQKALSRRRIWLLPAYL